jgi:hypothetical protein
MITRIIGLAMIVSFFTGVVILVGHQIGYLNALETFLLAVPAAAFVIIGVHLASR